MTSKPPWYTLLVALLLIVGFGWLSFYMIGAAMDLPKDEQYRWDHLVVIFNSIQTMAAAAVGVLLGTTVQQAKVDAARSEADAAKARADAHADDAARTRTVRGIVSGLQPPGAAKDTDATLRAVEAALRS